jgi:pimeloyl-ACP methyl ester carboxylesterase
VRGCAANSYRFLCSLANALCGHPLPMRSKRASREERFAAATCPILQARPVPMAAVIPIERRATVQRMNGHKLSLAIASLVGALVQGADGQVANRSPLPVPTGRHTVGRTAFDWIDQSRPDSTTPSHYREVVVWAWYPAAVHAGESAEWMPGKWGQVFWSEYSKGHGGSSAVPDLSAIRTHAYADAAIESSTQKYPLLLFAPGSGTTPLDYSGIIEDIVSHGYIVLGVESEFGRASVFADGRVVPGHDPVPRGGPGAPRSTEQAIRAWEDAASGFGKDLSFALNQLTALRDTPLSRLADVTRVGVFGHSLGGAAALQCAHDDSRVRAVFDIDGSPIWSARNGRLQKPVMILSAASTNLSYDGALGGAMPAGHLRVAGTVHSFPSDIRVMPFAQPTTANTQLIAPSRGLVIAATFVEAFFGNYLLGQHAAILSAPSREFPEVTFEKVP